MTIAFSLCNGVLLIGQNRLGLSIGLRGNGMCLTRRGLARHPWEADGLTEDIEFSWMLRSQGERIYFVREARVYSDMVSKDINAAKSQRVRWEEGRRSMRARFLHPLLFSSNLSVYEKLMYLLELTLPSLVSLMLLLMLAASAAPARSARFDARIAVMVASVRTWTHGCCASGLWLESVRRAPSPRALSPESVVPAAIRRLEAGARAEP